MYQLLLVDDEEDVLEAVRTAMPWEKYEIELVGVCRNALEALEFMEKTPPDIVVTDVKMPVINGIEMIRRARKQGVDAEFIVLSGFDEFEFAKSAMSFGVRYYLLKPCSEEELGEALEGAEEDCRRRRRAFQALYSREEDVSQAVYRLEEGLSQGPEALSRCLSREMERSGRNLVLMAGIKLLLKQRGDLSRLSELFNSLYEIRDSREFISVLADFFQQAEGGKGEGKPNFVDEIVQYIDSHLDDSNLSLKWVSGHLVFRNEDYVGKAFSAHMGETFLSYVNRRRIERAKFLLSTLGEDKIYMVAEQIGFGHNPRYFSKLFRKYTGYSPREYLALSANPPEEKP